MTSLLIDRIDSPVGEIMVISDGRALWALDFHGYEDRMLKLMGPRADATGFREADDPQGFSSRVRAYFEGRFEALDDIPVETGGTSFQREVWLALRAIKPGETESYGALAKRLGRPGASRAVGRTNGLNPVAIVLPCHRVIGADGSLTGYGGGLERKRWLLAHEGAWQESDVAEEKTLPLFET